MRKKVNKHIFLTIFQFNFVHVQNKKYSNNAIFAINHKYALWSVSSRDQTQKINNNNEEIYGISIVKKYNNNII